MKVPHTAQYLMQFSYVIKDLTHSMFVGVGTSKTGKGYKSNLTDLVVRASRFGTYEDAKRRAGVIYGSHEEHKLYEIMYI